MTDDTKITRRSGITEMRQRIAALRTRLERLLLWRVWERMLEIEFVDRSVALAGKAFVSTSYLHALELLDRGRGILVPFRDAPAIATAVNSVLSDPQRKRELEVRAYEYGKQMAWPAIGRRVLATDRALGSADVGVEVVLIR